MRRKLHAHAVSRQLADAGHVRAKIGPEGVRAAGFWVTEAGRGVVVCFEAPAGEVPRLEPSTILGYARSLQTFGYVVEIADRPMMDGQSGRQKIYVTRRGDDAS